MPTQYINLRDEEVQELLDKKPSWFLQWSITLFSLILGLLIYGSWLIHFPEIIPVTFTLTSINAPTTELAHVDGKITKLLVNEGDFVEKGTSLAYMESSADHGEVEKLSDCLKQAWILATTGQLDKISKLNLNDFHRLGELQLSYQPFALANLQLQSYLSTGFFNKRRALLKHEANDLLAIKYNLEQQREIHSRDLELADNEFKLQRMLVQQKVIAQVELSHEETKLLSHKLPYRLIEASLINNGIAQRGKQMELLELDKTMFEQRDQFLQALNTLQSLVADWEHKYIIVASNKGKVHLPLPLQENQQVNTGQKLFYVTPNNVSYSGQILIPQLNSGKIEVGQRVLIHFNGYPYQEYGLIGGKINSIAEIPLRDGFIGQVRLPNKLITSTGRKLNFKLGMTGSAEIVTKDQRLLQRLFNQLSFNL